MNKTLREMFVGLLLGDGHIRRSGLNKAYITFEQSSAKKEYIQHVESILKQEGVDLNETREYSHSDPRYNSVTTSIQLSTKASENLKELADMFLDEEGNKKVPANISEHLTVRGLAHWIMDDGQQVKKGGVTLCTDSFNSEQVGILRQALETNFNLITSIHKKKNTNSGSIYERIYVYKNSLDDIKTDLKEHMHPTMYYKLNILDESSEVNTGLNTESNTNLSNTNLQNKTNIESLSDFSDSGSDID